MFRRATSVCAVLAVAAGCGGETSEPPAGDGLARPDIVFVSIDSLRADHVGAYGYTRDTTPFLDELASEGVRFANAISTTSWTLPSHAAMFTGLSDSVHGLVDNGLRLAAEHLTLAELLQHQGYRTAGFFGGPYLHPAFGVAQGFDDYVSCMSAPDDAGDDDVRTSARKHRSPSHADITGPRTRERIASWADRTLAARDDRPFFLFVHLWDVHYDFIPPAEYAALFDPDYTGEIDGRLMTNAAIREGMSARDLEHVIALYDAEVRFTDDVLRGIFGDLEARGMLADAVVVVTADHGEEFFEHGKKGHNKSLYDEVLRVPLIVRMPGLAPERAGSVIDTQVQIIDLMPTLARCAGWERPLAVQGRDLGPAITRGSTLPERDALTELLIDRGELRALRDPSRKVIEPRRDAPAVLFDLALDPGERDPIHANSRERQDERERAQSELALAIARTLAFRDALDRAADEFEVSDDMAEQLRALGYLGEDE